MNFLAIESATKSPGAAIYVDDQLIDESKLSNGNSSDLAPLINDLILKNKVNAQDFDFIAVTIGPGTFTGLRVGISLAQGMSYSISKSIVPVNVLDVISSKVAENGEKNVAFHSHADFIYHQRYNTDDSLKLVKIDDIEGQTVYGCNLNQYSDRIDYKKINFSAIDVAEYAIENFDALIEDDIGSVTPIYLHEFKIG